MKKGLRSLIALALAISLGTGGLFLALPKKAEAGITDCLAGVLFGKTKGKAEVTKAGMSGFGQTVPVKDASVKAMTKANANINANTSGQTQGFTVQRCIVEPLVTVMVRSILNTFTAQTINWINSGFKGSPLYVTNPEGFLTDIADQSLGQFIGGLGDIGQILCSPFDLQLRFSLNLQFGIGGGYYQEIGCRLTDIQQNIQKTFTGGSFGADGWDNWLQLTAQPQNNPYGAFIKASESLNSIIGNRQESKIRELNWGKGFLSSTDPVTGEVNTPGSLIEDQLSKTLGVEVERVGLAKDIDAILGALVNQLINQVMGGVGGLLGASRRPSGGSGNYQNYAQSPVERARDSTPASIIAANEAAQGLPDGFYVETGINTMPILGPTATDEFGKPTGPTPAAFCTAFKKNIYSADKSATGNILTTLSPIVVKVDVAGKTAGKTGEALADALAAIPNTATKKDGVPPQWNLADYNRIATFCQSVNITAPIGNAARDFNEQTVATSDDATADDTPPETTEPVNNLALNKPTKQSSTYTQWSYYPEAKLAVNNDTTGNTYYGLALTQNNDDEWWQVELGTTSKNIGTVKVYRTTNGDYLNYPFYVFVTTEDMGEATTNNILSNNSGKVVKKIYVDATTAFGNRGSNVASFAVNAVGRYVRISKYYSDTHLGLAEVEVIPAGGNGNAEAVVTPPLSFSKRSNETSLVRNQTFSDEVVLTAGKDLDGLKVRVKLANNTNLQVQQFPVYFNMFKITMGLPGGDEATDIVVMSPGCFYGNQCLTINPALGAAYGGVITLNKAFSLKSGNGLKISLTGTASEFAWGSQKFTLEIIDATGTVLATYEKVLSLGQI